MTKMSKKEKLTKHSAPIARVMLTATLGLDTGTHLHRICNQNLENLRKKVTINREMELTLFMKVQGGKGR
jgi:pyruvate/2-oxoglutarate dehydrogenase complex dihydrolipoamide acyltransferase (E2) component